MSEITEEKSKEFAASFDLLKFYLQQIDWEYAADVVKALYAQVSRQESLGFLNPTYPPKKNELIKKQADALNKFVEAVQLLKECDRLKLEIEKNSAHYERVQGLFL